MSYQQSPKKVIRLSEEDRAEMRALSTEFATAATKIARILSTTLGVAHRTPRKVTGVIIETPGGPIVLETGCITIELPDGTEESYQDPPGVCCTGPCPCV